MAAQCISQSLSSFVTLERITNSKARNSRKGFYQNIVERRGCEVTSPPFSVRQKKFQVYSTVKKENFSEQPYGIPEIPTPTSWDVVGLGQAMVLPFHKLHSWQKLIIFVP